ncbi:hypothetical protein CCZ01_09490 [Helicobacter monodelphidis]|nr:hypothetical protein CCZ01_09490 [Helicobacter sp. 15-1451]
MAESPHVDLEIQQKRLHICLACDRLFALTKNCKECGCFVKMKVKYKKSECPLGKWDAEE